MLIDVSIVSIFKVVCHLKHGNENWLDLAGNLHIIVRLWLERGGTLWAPRIVQYQLVLALLGRRPIRGGSVRNLPLRRLVKLVLDLLQFGLKEIDSLLESHYLRIMRQNLFVLVNKRLAPWIGQLSCKNGILIPANDLDRAVGFTQLVFRELVGDLL